MLTTLTIISIFMEIFASGIFIAGFFTFLKNYLSSRQTKDLVFSLVFLAMFVYVAATVASQLMFNLGRPLSELILVHRWITISIILCALLVVIYIIEKFEIKALRWGLLLLVPLVILFTYLIMDSSLNLIYREGVIEPVVDFSLWVPAKPLLTIAWALLSFFSFIRAAREPEGKKKLLHYLGASALVLVTAFLCAYMYESFGDAVYLLVAWTLTLFASLGFLLAEQIPADSPDATRPLHYLRTRILFKLMLIFVLLIVILFEATTLATINIGKNALSRAITSNYLRTASELAAKIEVMPEAPSFEALQKIVIAARGESQAVAYIVDMRGVAMAHPDAKRALQHESLLKNQAVQKVIGNNRGSGEFRDEIGDLVVGAYVPVGKYNMGVVVQEQISLAYFELRRLETNSLLFVIAGIFITAIVGIFFARSIERPIKDLTIGTEAVAKGDLRWQVSVNSADEIGRLAAAFNLMTQELRDSQERLILSEKLASLGTMAAGMAHEIKNPLVSLRTFTQLLQQKWDDKEFRDKFSAIIPQEIERINRIAESLLKFGRPRKPELGRADINALVDEVLLLFESECKKYNVRVTKKLVELPEIMGDAGQLQQAFVNIVKNAIESMSEKGGELIVKTDVGEVVKLGKMAREGRRKGEEFVWGEEDEMGNPVPVVFIEITDTGEGISEENLKSLFDPFFTTKMSGTGMGLPITLRIIEEHKGFIKVRSVPGKGTTFIITLPQKLN